MKGLGFPYGRLRGDENFRFLSAFSATCSFANTVPVLRTP